MGTYRTPAYRVIAGISSILVNLLVPLSNTFMEDCMKINSLLD